MTKLTRTTRRTIKLNLPIRLVLYSRNYCHLCQDMLTALERLRSELVFSLTVIDVDTDSRAEQKYDELVPVLTDGDDVELCHYHLDEAKVRAVIAGHAG